MPTPKAPNPLGAGKMKYADLTVEQKGILASLGNYMRSASIEFAKLGIHGNAISATWNGNADAIIASLDDGEMVPNGTSLAGAQDLSKADFQNLAGYFVSVSATPDNSPGSYNTNFHRALYAKAAGTQNVDGSK